MTKITNPDTGTKIPLQQMQQDRDVMRIGIPPSEARKRASSIVGERYRKLLDGQSILCEDTAYSLRKETDRLNQAAAAYKKFLGYDLTDEEQLLQARFAKLNPEYELASHDPATDPVLFA